MLKEYSIVLNQEEAQKFKQFLFDNDIKLTNSSGCYNDVYISFEIDASRVDEVQEVINNL